jgi:hypothetical protein
MFGVRKKHITGFLLLLGVVRWYNLALIAASQYLLFWLAFSNHEFSRVLYDFKLHCIVAASVFSVAAAFIINAFYDVDKEFVRGIEFFGGGLCDDGVYSGDGVFCVLHRVLLVSQP